MSSLVQTPSSSGWPQAVRGTFQFGSLTFAAVVSAGIARSADGARSGAPPRPPPPPARPPPCLPGACAAGAPGAAGAPAGACAASVAIPTAVMTAARADAVVTNRFIRFLCLRMGPYVGEGYNRTPLWLRQAPGCHAALLLDVAGLDRIGEAASEPPGPVVEHRLVDDEAVGAVGKVHAAAGGAHFALEADVRGEPREQQPVRRQHAPHLLDHAAELCGVIREVQDCAADHRIEHAIVEWKVFQVSDLEVSGRQRRREHRRQLADACDRRLVPIDAVTVESTAQEVHEIAPVAAACVEHTPPRIEAPSEDLIEQVDVDLAEPRAQLRARRRGGIRLLHTITTKDTETIRRQRSQRSL